jgi:pimeloyl-ACP methyl ester carboxylesterase
MLVTLWIAAPGPAGAQTGRGSSAAPGVRAIGLANGQFADLPGVRLWYTDTGGKGEAVLLLHANTGTSENWRPQLDALSRAGYRVIAFDRRGWGRSVVDPGSGSQPGTTADDLQALADFLALQKFHLIGVAGGGFIALDYAAWHGDRLRSMIVAASTGSLADKEIVDFSSRIAIPGLRDLPAQYREVGASYRGENPEGLRRWIEVEAQARQPGAPAQPLRSPNTFEKLATIEVRTLVMPGEADLIAPPALMKIWAPYLKNAEWTSIPDAGHSVAWERPDAFNAKVMRFLKGDRFERVKHRPPGTQ